MKRLSSKWDTVVAAPVFDRQRSPPPRRVSFNNQPNMSFSQERGMNRSPVLRRVVNMPRFTGNRPIMSPGMGSSCIKCGRNQHANINFCPANNKNCNYCGKRGHFAVMCRLARRNRALEQQSSA